jgi:hypothetical protein
VGDNFIFILHLLHLLGLLGVVLLVVAIDLTLRFFWRCADDAVWQGGH